VPHDRGPALGPWQQMDGENVMVWPHAQDKDVLWISRVGPEGAAAAPCPAVSIAYWRVLAPAGGQWGGGMARIAAASPCRPPQQLDITNVAR
jgi:hypothetical protein